MVTTLVKRYSFEEYCQYDDGTDTRYELDNGKLIAMTPPKGLHFLIAQRLETYLTAEIQRQQKEWICLRDAGLKTSFEKSRLPDVMVVEKAKFMALLDKSLIFDDPPLFVVEIVSPESIARDYRYKRSEYAAIAVPEYWVIDPSEGKVTTFIFNEGLYDEIIFMGEQTIVSPQFSELKLTPQTILSI
jgi:Uma2 family endonuclease